VGEKSEGVKEQRATLVKISRGLRHPSVEREVDFYSDSTRKRLAGEGRERWREKMALESWGN
jgi:hypothetical protein